MQCSHMSGRVTDYILNQSMKYRRRYCERVAREINKIETETYESLQIVEDAIN